MFAVPAEDVAQAVDAVPDVEADEAREQDEAEQIAAKLLHALAPEVRAALGRIAAPGPDL